MNIEKKRKVCTQIIIMTIAIALMIVIWPAGLLKHTIRSAPAEDAAGEQREFAYGDKLLQTFTPQCDYLKQIRLYIQCRNFSEDDTLTFVLYNSEYAPIFQKTYVCGDIAVQEYLTIDTELSLVPGEVCYYEILLPEESQGRLLFTLGNRQEFLQVENGILFDNGIPDDQHAFWADYVYVQPLSVLRTVVYYIAILVIGGILYFGILNLWVQFPRSFEISGKCIRTVAAIFVAGLMVVTLYFAVMENIFGGALLDRIVYAIGITVAGIWAFIGLFHKKQTYVEVTAATSVSDMWRAYLQTLCFAGVIYSNCMYANAAEMKYQYENTRWMLIFLGLALVTCIRIDFHQKKDRIFAGIGFVWMAGAFLYALRYVQAYAGDENATYLAKLYMAVMIIWGVLLIHAVRLMKKEYFTTTIRNISWMQWLQIGAMVLFCIGMFVYRYEKIWPFEILIPIMVLLVLGLQNTDKDRMLRNLCNGILLAFVMMTVNSLLYRPYMRWMYYRYPGYFHTVACTGMFLTIVVCAALVKFYIKAHGSEHIFRDTWKELFFCSTAFIYVFLTMSRTAFMAIGVLFVGIVILTAMLYKKKWKQILIEIGLILGITVTMFPMVYSATRMIPALVNKPYRFEPIEPTVDVFHDMIVEGDALDSAKYMSMERFLTLFAARVQLPEFLTQKSETVEEAQDVVMEQDAALQAEESSSFEYTEADAGVDMESSLVDTLEDDKEENEEIEEEEHDTFEVSKGLTNGRMDIYKTYLSQLTMKGHEKMGYQSPDGTKDYGHAHNSYIQVFYDFGIPTGIAFLVLCLITFIHSIYVTVKLGNKLEYALFIFGLVVVFGVVSVTEWAFHPSIPIGFTFIWSIGLLMSIGTKNKMQK